MPVAPVPTTATRLPRTSMPFSGQKEEWHILPSKDSSPGQSGQVSLCSESCAAEEKACGDLGAVFTVYDPSIL